MALLTCLLSHKKSAADKEIKPGVQSWLPEMLIQNPLWAVPYGTISAPKDIQTRCGEKGVKCFSQRKRKVSNRVWSFIYLFVYFKKKQTNPPAPQPKKENNPEIFAVFQYLVFWW